MPAPWEKSPSEKWKDNFKNRIGAAASARRQLRHWGRRPRIYGLPVVDRGRLELQWGGAQAVRRRCRPDQRHRRLRPGADWRWARHCSRLVARPLRYEVRWQLRRALRRL